MTVAVCDPAAFYPFRSLVEGPFTNLRELTEVERLLRAVVLHDEISMELEPWPCPYPEDRSIEEDGEIGARNVIVALGPVLTGYDFFEHSAGNTSPELDVTLSAAMIEAAQKFSNAEEGSVYYKAHIQYLQRIINTVNRGGSAVIAGDFGSCAIDALSTYPWKLFESLDEAWQLFAQEADAGKVGVILPPVLSIVLSRCSKRDAIPAILKDLRDEWAEPRKKVWTLLAQLKTAPNVQKMRDIKRELVAASQLMSPAQDEIDLRPVRVLWDFAGGGVTGGATALLSGGHPGVGAAIGALGMASRSVLPLIYELGPALFGRGAFDLARRVRKETMLSDYSSLARLLTDKEKEKLKI